MHRYPGTVVAVVFAVGVCSALPAGAHPGSGIVVSGEGEVFFVDGSPPPPEGTGREIVWKLGKDGKLTASTMGGGHWLAIDAGGNFARVDFNQWFQQRSAPNFVRIMPSDFGPPLIATDGQPFVFNRDGNLYYAKGNLELTRLTPQGKSSPVMPNMIAQAQKLGGIKGLACGPDGSLYVSYPQAVQKVTVEGHASMLAEGIEMDRSHVADPATPGPYLRGLAVAADGTVYAAASNCRAVLKLTADGKTTTTFLKSDPWIPTGVAVAGDNVYVLEFDDAPPAQWRPRVRKIGADGKINIVATITR
jgi:DNA-binding beta-propeller fold protein YncE